MKTISFHILFLLSVVVVVVVVVVVLTSATSCTQRTKNTKGEVQDTTLLSDTVGAIAVTPLSHAKDFPGALLGIRSIESVKTGTDSAKVTVKYEVQNFNLTEQTDHDHHMANSSEGQHIHFILDNQPYVALYKPEHTVTLPLDSEHYLMSFLSRSFHESLKSTDAFKLVKFKVDAQGKVTQSPPSTDPAIFYSRPKGDYKGADTKSILLDFFVVNTTLDAAGNKVKAQINDQEFILDHWTPYEISNLPMGENKIKLSLIDKDGHALKGDHVSIEHKINLSDQ